MDHDGKYKSQELSDDRFDFHKHRLVQVEKDIFAFKSGQPVRVIKYTNPKFNSLIRKTRLPSLEERLKYFAVTSVNKARVILTGGWDENIMKESAKCFSFNLAEELWSIEEEPDLNKARSVHSSTALGFKAFAICGFDGDLNLHSIEMMDCGPKPPNVARSWQLIQSDMISPRQAPAVSPLNETSIVVLGGWHNGHLSDVIILNTVEGNAERVLHTQADFGFQCRSTSMMEEDGTVISLVADQDEVLHFVRYIHRDNTLAIT